MLDNCIGSTHFCTASIFIINDSSRESTTCAQQEVGPVLSIVTATVLVAFPSTTLIGSNVMFVVRLLRRRQKKDLRKNQGHQMSQLEARRKSKADNERSYVKLLRITTCSYLTLLFASVMLTNTSFYFQQQESTRTIGQIMRVTILLPVVLNNSLNFCFYYISGPMFKEAFSKAFFKKQKN